MEVMLWVSFRKNWCWCWRSRTNRNSGQIFFVFMGPVFQCFWVQVNNRDDNLKNWSSIDLEHRSRHPQNHLQCNSYGCLLTISVHPLKVWERPCSARIFSYLTWEVVSQDILGFPVRELSLWLWYRNLWSCDSWIQCSSQSPSENSPHNSVFFFVFYNSVLYIKYSMTWILIDGPT